MTDERDFNAEILDLVKNMTPVGDFTARIVAEDVIAKLRANDPGLLAGWLDLRAGEILGAWIVAHYNSLRSRSRVMAPRKAFAEAAERFTDTGDIATLGPFGAVYVVDHANLRRRVADMVGDDHLFVADHYADDKHTAAMLEAFHRAVAKKIGTQRTADVFSADQYLTMYRSITRTELPAAA